MDFCSAVPENDLKASTIRTDMTIFLGRGIHVCEPTRFWHEPAKYLVSRAGKTAELA
jgi:hypothetical protein